MTADAKTSIDRGAQFETEVADLLKLRGFSLVPDIRLGGLRADLIATKGLPPFRETYLVEAKDQERPVGNEAVLKLAGAVSGYRKTFPRIIGLLVSKGGFTADAKAAAESQDDIRIVTLEQLVDGLIDFSSYLAEYAQSYRDSPMHNLFVDPGCKQEGPEGPKEWPSLTRRMREWLADPTSRKNLILLGEYGSGKTVFVEHFAFLLAEEILRGDSSDVPTPIVIYLRHFTEALGDLRRVITSHLVDDLRLEASYDAFVKLLKRGRILLMLDGFDEMAMVVDAKTRDHNFLVLQTLCTGNARVVLTGRPEYFPSDEDMESLTSADRVLNPMTHVLFEPGSPLPEFDKLHVTPFDEAHISSYLKRCERHYQRGEFPGVETVAARIKQTDLHGLATRPVLLDLIVKTLPTVMTTKKKVTAADLYDFYTQFWLGREEEKGKRLIPAQVKTAFVHELAWKMVCNGRFYTHYNDLPSDIIDFFRPHRDADLEAYDHDIRACSYLHRDSKGNFSFAHKTFMEFFVASRTHRELLHSRSNPLAVVRLPSEILAFLADLSDETVADIVGGLAYSFGGNEIFQDNALRFLAKLTLEAAVWAHIECVAYFPGTQSHPADRLLRQRVEHLLPEQRIPAVARVFEMQEKNADDRLAHVVRRYVDLLGADSIAVKVFAEHLRKEQPFSTLISEAGIPAEFLYQACAAMERIRHAIEQVCGFPDLDASLRGREESIPPREQSFFTENLHAPLPLVRDILKTFDLSLDEARQFLRHLNLGEPKEPTAASIVTESAIHSFAQQTRLPESAAGQILTRSNKKPSALIDTFKSLPMRSRNRCIPEIQRAAGLVDKSFRTYFPLVVLAARKAGLLRSADSS
jgi:hypothetical protein